MEHVVFFPGADAAPSFQRFASLEEAVRFVEHLRNAEDVSEVSVHALTPVPVAFRAYYKVEVPVTDGPEAPVLVDVPAPAGEPVLEQVLEPAAEADGLDEPSAGLAELAEMADRAEMAEMAALAEVPELLDDAEPVLMPVPDPDAEPSSNGKRSLGFFAH
jgi:hypothetical protein